MATNPPTSFRRFQRRTLPGFGLTLGYTTFYLSLIVLIPFIALFLKTSTISWEKAHSLLTDGEVISAFKVSFGCSLLAALINAFLGLPLAWILSRYEFPGRKLLDAFVDLPFALPTAVAGIALTAIYSPGNGWIGKFLNDQFGIRAVYSQTGIVIALVFVTLPFVVRTLQPVLLDLSTEVEEAAACLGATRWQTFTRVVWPAILPALVTGVSLAFGRAVGEYGSIAFVSANIPYATQIVPKLIVARIEMDDGGGGALLGAVMLVISFIIIIGINLAQNWNRRRMSANNS